MASKNSSANILRIVLLGPPGAGKGTQALLLSRDKNLAHISTGEIMRAAVAEGNSVGQRVKSFLDKGELVPDELVFELVTSAILSPLAEHGFVLDGFPRNLDQALELGRILERLDKSLTHVIDFAVPTDVLFERIRKRGESIGRSDDSDNVAARRLEVYFEQTAPVTAHYESFGTVHRVNGLGTVEEVYGRLLEAVEQ
jgi:adenylate kinase